MLQGGALSPIPHVLVCPRKKLKNIDYRTGLASGLGFWHLDLGGFFATGSKFYFPKLTASNL